MSDYHPTPGDLEGVKRFLLKKRGQGYIGGLGNTYTFQLYGNFETLRVVQLKEVNSRGGINLPNIEALEACLTELNFTATDNEFGTLYTGPIEEGD